MSSLAVFRILLQAVKRQEIPSRRTRILTQLDGAAFPRFWNTTFWFTIHAWPICGISLDKFL